MARSAKLYWRAEDYNVAIIIFYKDKNKNVLRLVFQRIQYTFPSHAKVAA